MIDELIDEIKDRRNADLRSRIKRYPRERLIASDMHECNRYLVYSVLDWDKRPLHDEGLQALFDAGNDEEKNVIRKLLGYNFEVIEGQTPFEIKSRQGEVMCRGKIDGKIKYKGQVYPFEIKSMDSNIFNSLNTLDDFLKKPQHRKYLRQIQLYLFGNNCEEGLFILSDFRRWKLLKVYLDYEGNEYILQRIERVWDSIKKKEYLDRIDYNPSLCDRCPFLHVCLPENKKEGVNLVDSEELETKLTRREELKPLIDEYDSIDKEVKEAFREIPETIIGTNWRILSQKREQVFVNTKAMPEEVKKPYEEKREVITVRIVRLGEKQ